MLRHSEKTRRLLHDPATALLALDCRQEILSPCLDASVPMPTMCAVQVSGVVYCPSQPPQCARDQYSGADFFVVVPLGPDPLDCLYVPPSQCRSFSGVVTNAHGWINRTTVWFKQYSGNPFARCEAFVDFEVNTFNSGLCSAFRSSYRPPATGPDTYPTYRIERPFTGCPPPVEVFNRSNWRGGFANLSFFG